MILVAISVPGVPPLEALGTILSSNWHLGRLVCSVCFFEVFFFKIICPWRHLRTRLIYRLAPCAQSKQKRRSKNFGYHSEGLTPVVSTYRCISNFASDLFLRDQAVLWLTLPWLVKMYLIPQEIKTDILEPRVKNSRGSLPKPRVDILPVSQTTMNSSGNVWTLELRWRRKKSERPLRLARREEKQGSGARLAPSADRASGGGEEGCRCEV